MKRIRHIASQKKRALMRRVQHVRNRQVIFLRALLALEAFALFGALVFALSGGRASLFAALGTHADIWAIATASILLGLLQIFVNNRVVTALERRFSPEVYDERRILFDLGQAARASATLEQLFKLVVRQIEDALQTTCVAILVRDEPSGDYLCRISSQSLKPNLPGNKTEQLSLSKDAFIVKRLRNLSAPLGVNPQEFEAWTRALAFASPQVKEVRQSEIEILQQLDSRLLLQILMRNELIGIISLGPKANGRHFSAEDKQLLTAVAGQLAFIIEHSKLIGRIVEEERLRRELTVATEVQQRLFPSSPVATESLELSGFCQPAREVGGDYFDFITLDNGEMGVAVADVAGKGIAAALLMSIVQASLRSQAAAQSQILGNKKPLAHLAREMNRLLWRSTSAASYVTFFYAQFDENNHQLTYVNAGHNSPLLLRAGKKDKTPQFAVTGSPPRRRVSAAASPKMVETDALPMVGEAFATLQMPDEDFASEPLWTKLTTGGMALGLFDESCYEQEVIQMISGDLLFSYTDGVTEALNVEGEEFGETRLQTLLVELAHLPAEEVRDAIVERLLVWCQGTPQHDDLTFVVLKVK
ncbi:MAG TPA: SpoIIE family protein phosphatase [Pyrinomonadaceae bacterium]|jgi:sigma-B regulation protein RsbU (phosphoserine phosphatase)|nr:SpoIIE family protein phosphatase [Pyrinomonadaceae bacterium]